MQQTRFYSNGKLLLTGEYVVLDGAKSLALPTKFGQDLIVSSNTSWEIQWKSIDNDGGVWFEDIIGFEDIVSNLENTSSVKTTLIEILHHANILNPSILNTASGFSVTTTLTFPRFWGLGTSSTLLNNIAQWFKIDAFELLRKSFGGSGYDIAAAQCDHPIVYSVKDDKPEFYQAEFEPVFKDKLYFVYLNRKQSSRSAIATYKSTNMNREKPVAEINKITNAIIGAKDVESFSKMIDAHEQIISSVVGMKTVKETTFADFHGSIKSLGGWGGDFILVVSDDDPTPYFEERGFQTVIPYSDMIL